MSKWKSETTGLESKRQLQSHRDDKLSELISDNRLSPWCDADKAKQIILFAEADVLYEERKSKLKTAIQNLSTAKRKLYFTEIGLPANTDVNAWLVPSLVM